MTTHLEISPTELARLLREGRAPRVIDVREPHEWAIARIEGTELRPLSAIQTWWRELDPDEPVVFVCHHGRRSAAVCRALAAEGFTAVHDLVGGVEAWRLDVDPAMPAY